MKNYDNVQVLAPSAPEFYKQIEKQIKNIW